MYIQILSPSCSVTQRLTSVDCITLPSGCLMVAPMEDPGKQCQEESKIKVSLCHGSLFVWP